MNTPLFEFAPNIFFKVLAATLGLLFVGWAGAIWIYDKLSTTDMLGSLICVPIFTYLVHLWIVYGRENKTGG